VAANGSRQAAQTVVRSCEGLLTDVAEQHDR
jgi:hypothetical protein